MGEERSSLVPAYYGEVATEGKAVFDRFTEQARAAMVLAQDEARADGAAAVELAHLALGCVSQSDSDAARLLATVDVAAGSLINLSRPVTDLDRRLPKLTLADPVKRALEGSMRLAMTLGSTMVTSAHVLVTVVSLDPEGEVGGALMRAGADLTRLELTLAQMRPQEFIESGRRVAEPPKEG